MIRSSVRIRLSASRFFTQWFSDALLRRIGYIDSGGEPTPWSTAALLSRGPSVRGRGICKRRATLRTHARELAVKPIAQGPGFVDRVNLFRQLQLLVSKEQKLLRTGALDRLQASSIDLSAHLVTDQVRIDSKHNLLCNFSLLAFLLVLPVRLFT